MSQKPPHQQIGDTLWVQSDATLFGTYVCTIHVGPHRSFTPADPVAYAMTVVQAIERACYESAVARQMHKVGRGNLDATWLALKELRTSHAPLNHNATAPLTFDPVVAGAPGRNFHPSVHISLDGDPFCQWDRADAYSHLGHVLSCAVVAGIDGTYRKMLVREFDTGDDRAAVIVGDLATFRDAEQ